MSSQQGPMRSQRKGKRTLTKEQEAARIARLNRRKEKRKVKKQVANPKKDKKKNKETRPMRGKRDLNALGQTPRQALADPRLGKQEILPADFLQNALNTVSLTVTVEQQNLWMYSLGFVTRALEKGFAATASEDYYPYFAWVYLINLLSIYAQNGTVPAMKLPKVLHAVGRALSKKTVPCSNGKVTYNFALTGVGIPGVNQVIGSLGFGYLWSTGWVPATGGTQTNMFPNLITTSPEVYNVDEGLIAFQEMCGVLHGAGDGNKDLEDVETSSKTILDTDVAAYATVGQQQGSGAGGIGGGGFGTVAQLEVPIFNPLLTNMMPEIPLVTEITRYPTQSKSSGGDPCVLGAYLGFTVPLAHVGMQRSIKYHSINFFEFLETASLWVMGMQQAICNDQGGTFSENLVPADLTLPITFQEFSLLLRNVLMDAFQETQAGVQGLYMQAAASGTDTVFVPFVAGAGTCFIARTAMSLPVFLVENIRALVKRVAHRSETDLEMYVPVLGGYNGTVVTGSDFTFTSVGGTQTFPSFKLPTQAGFKKKVMNEKTRAWEIVPTAEVTISLWDGSANDNLVAINDPQQLAELASSFNDFINKAGLTSYSSKMAVYSGEVGINILYSGMTTRHWYASSVSQQWDMLKPERRTKLGLQAELGASPFKTMFAYADTIQSRPLSAVTSQVTSVWILPTVQQTFNPAITPVQSTVTTRYQFMTGETYTIPTTGGQTGIPLSTYHVTYASKMLKNRQSDKLAIDDFFETMSKQGRGGILSSLVGGALSSFFPSAASSIEAVASLVPF